MATVNKTIRRQVEYVHCALYALTMSCFVLIGILKYHDTLSQKLDFALFAIVVLFAGAGGKFLNDIDKQIMAYQLEAQTPDYSGKESAK